MTDQPAKKPAKTEADLPAEKTAAHNGFAELGLDPKLVTALAALGYEEPTPIQRETIPPVLAGRDLIGQAATGTGKTAAFALPMLQRLAEAGKKRPQPSALILVPTRELAMQVAEAVHKYGQRLKISVVPIYGGQAFGQQLRVLERGVDVVVATPGRALDHIRRGTLSLAGIAMLALDEADEMLDMGFAEDLEAILSETPEDRQTVLFSATLPPRIAGIAKRHLRDPLRIQIAREAPAKGALPKVRQTAYVIPRIQKLGVLSRVLDLENPTSALVFCRTRTEVDELAERLSAYGYRSQPLHGGISQDQRTRVIQRLRDGKIDLVIATDVAARGLDIEQLSHVVNYDVPATPESYVHRIGRVGRAGREGVAITLADPREARLLREFERATKGKIENARVPTLADLQAHRLELTGAALQEALSSDDLDTYRAVVEALAQEHDLMSLTLAAVKLAHQAVAGEHEEALAELPAVDQRDAKPRRAAHGTADRGSSRGAGGQVRRPGGGAMTRLWAGAGHNIGVRPQDLVGAITGEAGITGKQIGAIEIAERFSVVEVAEAVAEDVLRAMRGSVIKGRKVPFRKFTQH